jgi:hypothetical protein
MMACIASIRLLSQDPKTTSSVSLTTSGWLSLRGLVSVVADRRMGQSRGIVLIKNGCRFER